MIGDKIEVVVKLKHLDKNDIFRVSQQATKKYIVLGGILVIDDETRVVADEETVFVQGLEPYANSLTAMTKDREVLFEADKDWLNAKLG